MSNIKNKANIQEDKIDLARACIEHRATWMALTYEEMKRACVDAEKITRAAIGNVAISMDYVFANSAIILMIFQSSPIYFSLEMAGKILKWMCTASTKTT